MNEERMNRLLYALETIGVELTSISASLESISQALDGCISHTGNNNFLCVTGNVSTY